MSKDKVPVKGLEKQITKLVIGLEEIDWDFNLIPPVFNFTYTNLPNYRFKLSIIKEEV
jgi:hypothetical protein